MFERCDCDVDNVFMPQEVEILESYFLTEKEKYFRLRLKSGKTVGHQPGQMMELSLFGYGEIPIGFASSPTRKDSFEVLVRSVGRVSTAINQREKGESLWVRAPLGSGFDLGKLRGRDVLIIAGGIGLAPTRSLIQYVLDRRSEFKRFILFFGARTPKDQLFQKDLEAWRKSELMEFHETVDKADETWKGNVGVITTLFSKTRIAPEAGVVVCGPPVMYKFVLRELVSIGVSYDRIFLDLERRMKCGVGKCGHCQMNDLYVCMDGPVFSYAKIAHKEEAFG